MRSYSSLSDLLKTRNEKARDVVQWPCALGFVVYRRGELVSFTACGVHSARQITNALSDRLGDHSDFRCC